MTSKTMFMTDIDKHNFKKLKYQKHSQCILVSGKNAVCIVNLMLKKITFSSSLSIIFSFSSTSVFTFIKTRKTTFIVAKLIKLDFYT